MKGKKNTATGRKGISVLGTDIVGTERAWLLNDKIDEQNKIADHNKRLKGQKDNQEENIRGVIITLG